jgi:hypothetical protein
MRPFSMPLICIFLSCAPHALRAVDSIPESEQAIKALKIIDAYHGERPAAPPQKLHIVYFTPADRDPEPRYQERLTAIMEDIQKFYRNGMVRAGFGIAFAPAWLAIDDLRSGRLVEVRKDWRLWTDDYNNLFQVLK